MTRFGSLLSSSDAVTPEAVIEYPGGAVVQGLVFNSPSAAADNTAAINAAILTALRNGGAYGATPNGLGGRVILPAGDIHVNGTLLIRNARGLQLSGDGHSTRLIWQGVNDIDTPVVRLSHCNQCRVSDFQIIKSQNFAVGVRTSRDNHVGASVSPSKNIFENLYVEGSQISSFDVGGGNDMVDANNDFHIFISCYATNYVGRGFRILGSQAYNILFYSCHALGTPGIGSEVGLYANNDGCSFQWYGGGLYMNAVADFHIGRSAMPVSITRTVSESSGRFLLTENAAILNLELSGNRYNGEFIHADRKAISIQNYSFLKLTMENNNIGDAVVEENEIPLTIAVEGGSAPQHWNFTGNTIGTTLRDPLLLFPGHKPTMGAGNTYYLQDALTW